MAPAVVRGLFPPRKYPVNERLSLHRDPGKLRVFGERYELF